MFGRITWQDKLRDRLAAKRQELVNAELIAIEIPAIRKQIECLERHLGVTPPKTEEGAVAPSNRIKAAAVSLLSKKR